MYGSNSSTARARSSLTVRVGSRNPGKRFESAQCDNEFGLVAAVLVVANRRFHGNAECVLTTKTLVGLNGAGVRLK